MDFLIMGNYVVEKNGVASPPFMTSRFKLGPRRLAEARGEEPCASGHASRAGERRSAKVRDDGCARAVEARSAYQDGRIPCSAPRASFAVKLPAPRQNSIEFRLGHAQDQICPALADEMNRPKKFNSRFLVPRD